MESKNDIEELIKQFHITYEQLIETQDGILSDYQLILEEEEKFKISELKEIHTLIIKDRINLDKTFDNEYFHLLLKVLIRILITSRAKLEDYIEVYLYILELSHSEDYIHTTKYVKGRIDELTNPNVHSNNNQFYTFIIEHLISFNEFLDSFRFDNVEYEKMIKEFVFKNEIQSFKFYIFNKWIYPFFISELSICKNISNIISLIHDNDWRLLITEEFRQKLSEYSEIHKPFKETIIKFENFSQYEKFKEEYSKFLEENKNKYPMNLNKMKDNVPVNQEFLFYFVSTLILPFTYFSINSKKIFRSIDSLNFQKKYAKNFRKNHKLSNILLKINDKYDAPQILNIIYGYLQDKKFVNVPYDDFKKIFSDNPIPIIWLSDTKKIILFLLILLENNIIQVLKINDRSTKIGISKSSELISNILTCRKFFLNKNGKPFPVIYKEKSKIIKTPNIIKNSVFSNLVDRIQDVHSSKRNYENFNLSKYFHDDSFNLSMLANKLLKK